MIPESRQKPMESTPSVGRPLVSVITPFYNTGEYLAESIESVLAQSYGDFELVLVNNRSTDDGLKIAEQYAKRDRRIRVITNDTFLGKVANYNHAMGQISPASVYTKIVQADDWLFPQCLASMVSLAEENPRIGIVSSYFFLGSSLWNVGLPYPVRVFSGKEVCKRTLLGGGFFFGNFTTTMVRSEIVRSRAPYFNEATYHEDTESCYEILRDWDFGFVHDILSFTRTDNESLFKSTFDFNPDTIDFLISLHKYGPTYLDTGEYHNRLTEVERKYFAFLGRSAWSRRDEGFWDYHRNGLKIIGYDLGRKDMAKHAAFAVVDTLMRPSAALRMMKRKLLRA